MAATVRVFWQVITPILIVAGSGVLLAWFMDVSPAALSRVIFYILGPALVFSSIYGLSVDSRGIWQMLGFSLLYAASMLAIAVAIARILGFSRALASAFSLAGFLVNSGNYGLPLALFAFGEAGLQWAVLFYLTNSILSNSLGVFIAARGRESSRRALKSMLGAPVLYAALLGALMHWQGWEMPGPVLKAVNLAGGGAVPAMLVLLGVQLTRVKLDRDWKALGALTITRMGIGPVVGMALATLLGLSGLAWKVGVVDASMPTAVYTTILTSEYDAEPVFAAGAVLVTTLTSIVTLTVLLSLLR